MIEESSVSVSAPISAPAESNDSGNSGAPAAQQAPAPAEKLVPQSQVDKVVGRAKQEAYEKARQELLSQQQQSQPTPAQMYQAPQPNPVAHGNHIGAGGMQQPIDAHQLWGQLEQIASEKARAQATNAMVNDFVGRIEQAKTQFPGIENAIEELDLMAAAENDPVTIGRFMQNLTSIDNMPAVVNELQKHPEKYIRLLEASKSLPVVAQKLVKSISDSIKQNEQALNQKQPNEPLNQVSPSPTGTDNGVLTVSDLRRQDWLKV